MKNFLLTILLSSVVYAAPTTTTTTFGNEQEMSPDKYGNAVYNRNVTIKTDNYKVDNFWKKFSFGGDGQDKMEFQSIAKTGIMKISVEATSLCSLYPDVSEQGCSGQKPFLINKEALSAPTNPDGTITLMFQKDYNGTDILYTDDNDTVFYPLDVDRAEKYYKDTGSDKSHFSIFGSIFNAFFEGGFFSSFFNKSVVQSDGTAIEEDIRQKYIANIVSGIDQDHRLEKGITPLGTNVINTPVSLIDYTEDNSVTASGSCNLFFFRFSETNPMCNIMGGLPFISLFSSTTPSTTTNYTVDTIQADTQNALVTLAGTLAEETVTTYENSIVYQKTSSPTSIFSGMINMFKCFFFSCPKANDVEEPWESYYSFTEENAMNMTIAVVDTSNAQSAANKVDDLQTFKLMGIRNVFGNEHTCQVDESNYNDKWDDHTFRPNDDTKEETSTTKTCIKYWPWGSCREYEYDTTTATVDNTFSAKYMDETVQSNLEIDVNSNDELTPSEWLTWCDYMVDKYKGNVTTKCTGFFIFRTCSEVPADIKEDGYEILSYTNNTKVGLFIDVKPVVLTPESDNVFLRYKLIGTK